MITFECAAQRSLLRSLGERVKGALLPLKDFGVELQNLLRMRQTGSQSPRAFNTIFPGIFCDHIPRYSCFPLTSRRHRGWCHRAQAWVTVPRVIARSVPGMTAVDM